MTGSFDADLFAPIYSNQLQRDDAPVEIRLSQFGLSRLPLNRYLCVVIMCYVL